MKVLLHGANNTNFGDNLFIHLFYNELKKHENINDIRFVDIPIIGIKRKVATEINYQQKMLSWLSAERLIFFSGGYFGERTNSKKESLKRFLRYCVIGNIFIKKNVPIAIIGVGVGPITSPFLRKQILRLFDKAEVVIVRDQLSADYLKEYGLKKKVQVSCDTAMMLKKERLIKLAKHTENELHDFSNGRKLIFFHIPSFSSEAIIKISTALKIFINKHPEFSVVCGIDGYIRNVRNIKKYKKLFTDVVGVLGVENTLFHKYDGALSFCSFLNEMSFVITGKLHVGIVASSLEKSIVSFPRHQKIIRFYQQIGEEGRCNDISTLSVEQIYHIFDQYYNKPIYLDEKMSTQASDNLNAVKLFLNN